LLRASGVFAAVGLFVLSRANSIVALTIGANLSVGIAMKILLVVRIALCHALVPKPLMGRLIGAFFMFNDGLYPVAALAFGALAEGAGFPLAWSAAGWICLAGGAAFVFLPQFRYRPSIGHD